MYISNKALITCALLLLCSTSSQAGPMGFSDSYMVMGDFSQNWKESFINYAVSPRDALGVSLTYMKSDDDSKRRYLEEVTYTRLINRWNLPNAQANLWFVGGIGALQGKDDLHGTDRSFNKVIATPGIQLDYETTRVYLQATHRLYRSNDINHDYTSLRGGFSFYEAAYDKTQPWFILEARYMNDLSNMVEVTPMLRLINKKYFVEVGVNNSDQLRFNFMYIF
jgi:hypothetical protein